MIVESYLPMIGEIYGWDGLYLLYLLSRVKYGKIQTNLMPSVDDLHPIRCDGDQHFFRRFGEIQGGVGWAFEASPEPMPAE